MALYLFLEFRGLLILLVFLSEVSCSFPWVAVQVFDVFFLCAYMVIGFDWIPKGLCFCQIYHVDPSSPAQHSSTVSHQYHNCTITASVPLLLHHFLSDQQL